MPSVATRVNDSLNRKFTNRNGGPLYRVIWSEDRLEYFYGEMKPKYGVGRNRWVLEKWVAPEDYEPRDEWEGAKEAETGLPILGPFPTQGDFEHCYTFELDGVPFDPTEDLVHLVCTAIERGKMNHTTWERKAAIQKRMDDAKAEFKRQFDDLWDDSKPAPGAKIPDHILQMDSFSTKTVADIPMNLPQAGMKQMGSE